MKENETEEVAELFTRVPLLFSFLFTSRVEDGPVVVAVAVVEVLVVKVEDAVVDVEVVDPPEDIWLLLLLDDGWPPPLLLHLDPSGR